MADGCTRFVSVLLWVVTAALGLVVVMRLVAWDHFQPFVVLDAFTALIYLPAWIVLVVAALGRRFLLAGAALLIVVAQVAFSPARTDGNRARSNVGHQGAHPQAPRREHRSPE